MGPRRISGISQIARVFRAALARWGAEPWRSIWRLDLRPGSAAAFSFTGICVLIATAGHMLIGHVNSDAAIFAPYYSATLLASLVGGAAAGAFAMVLGGLFACWLFVFPEWSLAAPTLQNVDSWVLYGGSSLVIISAAASYRRLLQRLRQEEEKRRLLNAELAHRVKNTLANVQAIVNLTLRDHAELLGKVNARLAALNSTNELLIRSSRSSASLRDILSGEFAPYGLSRVRLEGAEVRCPSELAILLSLVLHELATNAAKYGALSRSDGQVAVSWRTASGRLFLDWVETGDLAVSAPTREGFGTKLLRCGLSRFDGHVEAEFRRNGFRCRISLLLPEDAAAERVERSALAPASNPPPSRNLNPAARPGPLP
jgi:two-component sensor histidine kinase/branched-subunit amino acid transport protein